MICDVLEDSDIFMLDCCNLGLGSPQLLRFDAEVCVVGLGFSLLSALHFRCLNRNWELLGWENS